VKIAVMEFNLAIGVKRFYICKKLFTNFVDNSVDNPFYSSLSIGFYYSFVKLYKKATT